MIFFAYKKNAVEKYYIIEGDEIMKEYGSIDDVTATIRSNLNFIMSKEGLSKADLRRATGVSDGTINNYMVKGKEMSLKFLIGICSIPALEPYNLTLDKLMDAKYQEKEQKCVERLPYLDDYCGAYVAYFIDCSQTDMSTASRYNGLRYGIIYIYEKKDTFKRFKLDVYAQFFKPEEKRLASKLYADINRGLLNDDSTVSSHFTHSDCYNGDAIVSSEHIFISLNCEQYRDIALVILHAPKKKSGTAYIGGMGCLCSITRGYQHMPTAQKMLLSNDFLNVSDDNIAELLYTQSIPRTFIHEAGQLVEFYKGLHDNKDDLINYLSDADKRMLLEGRLKLIIEDCLRNIALSDISVSIDEDARVYTKLKQIQCSGTYTDKEL